MAEISCHELSPKKHLCSAIATLKFQIPPIFCDDIFVGVVYIASVDIRVARVRNFIRANEGDDGCINLISGSFLAIDDGGQWRPESKRRYEQSVALQGGPA